MTQKFPHYAIARKGDVGTGEVLETVYVGDWRVVTECVFTGSVENGVYEC